MSKHKDFLKTLNLHTQHDWDLVSNNILLISDLLSFNIFPQEKLSLIPDKFFESPIFSLKVLSYYNPPLNKINSKFFEDINFLMELATKYPFNLISVPSKYITSDFINWYIDINSNQTDYLKYISLDQINEDIAIKVVENRPSDYKYIKHLFSDITFFSKIQPKAIAVIYKELPNDIKEDFRLLASLIVNFPSSYSKASPKLYQIDTFKKLLQINPNIFQYAPVHLQDDFNCALYSITKNPALIENLQTLKSDLEFFIACEHNLSTNLSPYLPLFGKKIFSDPACVNLVLDNLVETNRVSLIQEPVLSNPEIMFNAVKYTPSNIQYLGENLYNNIDFFNQLQYELKQLSSASPTQYIWFDMHQSLIQNLPPKSLNDHNFVINLFNTNKTYFLLHVYPIISQSTETFIEDLKNLNLKSLEEFSTFFAKFQHQKDLEKKLEEMNLSLERKIKSPKKI